MSADIFQSDKGFRISLRVKCIHFDYPRECTIMVRKNIDCIRALCQHISKAFGITEDLLLFRSGEFLPPFELIDVLSPGDVVEVNTREDYFAGELYNPERTVDSEEQNAENEVKKKQKKKRKREENNTSTPTDRSEVQQHYFCPDSDSFQSLQVFNSEDNITFTGKRKKKEKFEKEVVLDTVIHENSKFDLEEDNFEIHSTGEIKKKRKRKHKKRKNKIASASAEVPMPQNSYLEVRASSHSHIFFNNDEDCSVLMDTEAKSYASNSHSPDETACEEANVSDKEEEYVELLKTDTKNVAQKIQSPGKTDPNEVNDIEEECSDFMETDSKIDVKSHRSDGIGTKEANNNREVECGKFIGIVSKLDNSSNLTASQGASNHREDECTKLVENESKLSNSVSVDETALQETNIADKTEQNGKEKPKSNIRRGYKSLIHKRMIMQTVPPQLQNQIHSSGIKFPKEKFQKEKIEATQETLSKPEAIQDMVRPNVGEHLLFKIIKIGPDYSPVISKEILGKVESLDEKGLELHIIDGMDEWKAPDGKFSLANEEEKIEKLPSTVRLTWLEIIEPRIKKRINLIKI